MTDHANMATVLVDERGTGTFLLPIRLVDLGDLDLPPRLSIAEHSTNLRTTLEHHPEGVLLTVEGAEPSLPSNPPSTVVVSWTRAHSAPEPRKPQRPARPKLVFGDPLIPGAPSIKWSQIRNNGPNNFNGTVVATGMAAVLSVTPGEVVILPFEVCKLLLAGQPTTKWAAFTILPDTFGPTTRDNATGLDFWNAPANNPWGTLSGADPFYDAEGFNDNTPGADHARLFVDANNQPYLYQ